MLPCTPSLIAHVTETACKYSMINICAGVYAFLFDENESHLDVSYWLMQLQKRWQKVHNHLTHPVAGISYICINVIIIK